MAMTPTRDLAGPGVVVGRLPAVQIEPLDVPGAWSVRPRQLRDDRGVSLEAYTAKALQEAVGHPLTLAQVNCSVSARGVVRGVHFAAVPPGQAKYVTCVRGAVLDVVVDLRVGSPAFGAWQALRLDDVERGAVYVAEGLGHAFMALTDDATVVYLCSTGYEPAREHGVHPLDPALGIAWPAGVEPRLSEKDADAPTLADARDSGLLPTFEQSQARYAALRA